MAVVADVFECVIVDSDGDVIGTTTLQDGNIETQVQETDVRSGRGNQLRGVLHAERDITINLTDVGFSYSWLAKQLGQTIKTGAGIAYQMPKFHTVAMETTNKVITLEETPTSIDSIALYDKDGVRLMKTTDFTMATNKLTILKAGISAGDSVEVRTYTYATDAETQTIDIDNSVFAKGVRLVLETIEIDESTETTLAKLQWNFERALPSGNFTISTSSAKEASTSAYTFRVVRPTNSSVVGKSLRIPISPN